MFKQLPPGPSNVLNASKDLYDPYIFVHLTMTSNSNVQSHCPDRAPERPFQEAERTIQDGEAINTR